MQTFDVQVGDRSRVSARLYDPAADGRTGITFVLAPGAGAPHTSAFMVAFAERLAARGFDTATFNFEYMEAGRRIPDEGRALQRCYAAVVRHLAGLPRLRGNHLVAGGKSMGGRIASQMVAHDRDVGSAVHGLVFLGYPLHPPGKPAQARTRHLPTIRQPMLFVQGERDAFGTPDELRPALDALTADTSLFVVRDGDHSFKVPKRSGLTPQDVVARVTDEIVRWVVSHLSARR